MKKPYDALIIGAGLYGAVTARLFLDAGLRVKVLEKRSKVGGNIRTKEKDGIHVHLYGAHIFHTSDREVYDFVERFVTMRPFVNTPIANYKGKLYHLPFNMNTFYALWGTVTPEEAKKKIEEERAPYLGKEPENLEEQGLQLVGPTIYETLVKGYTEKQWGRSATELPAFILRRLPLRFTYDDNYFRDPYQGIPEEGYTALVERLLEGAVVETGRGFLQDKEKYKALSDYILFTGPIDEYFEYCFGPLEYRSLRFETERVESENVQGVPVMNYTDAETPYTRIIEHKHFLKQQSPVSYITREYPAEWKIGDEPFYPVNDEKNQTLYADYSRLADEEEGVRFGGRLGLYRYLDMDKVVREAMDRAKDDLIKIFGKNL